MEHVQHKEDNNHSNDTKKNVDSNLHGNNNNNKESRAYNEDNTAIDDAVVMENISTSMCNVTQKKIKFSNCKTENVFKD